MGARGPIPMSPSLKALRGNPSKRRLSATRSVAQGVPTPPTWLAKEARAEWDRILPEQHRRGVVGLLDRAVLTMYCEAWSRWVQAARSVSELVVRGRTSGACDTVVKAPAWTVYRHAADHCLALAKEIGLSPAARLRMQLPELPDHDPELDALLRPVRPGDGLDWGAGPPASRPRFTPSPSHCR